MAGVALTDRCPANLYGVPSCHDRIIITGTLPGACYAGGMTSGLLSRGIRQLRVFGYKNLLVCDGAAMPANPGVNRH
jgi:hypothetical protein